MKNIQFWPKMQENVKGLVHEKFKFWPKIQENVKVLVHEKFKFWPKIQPRVKATKCKGVSQWKIFNFDQKYNQK